MERLISNSAANAFSTVTWHDISRGALHEPSSLHDNPLNSSQVFASVYATVADHVLHKIPCSVSSFFEKQQITIGVQMEEKENNVYCVLHGDMPQILEAQKCLQSHLGAYSGAPPLAWGESAPATCDKSVLCELIKADKPYSIALDRPRRKMAAKLYMNNGSYASSPAIRIKEKYNKKRSSARARKMLMSKKPGKETINYQLTEPENGKENIETNNSSRQIDALDDGRVQDPADDFSDGDDPLDDDGSEDDSSPKKLRKNYEELTPYKFFCDICSFKTKRESHYQKHLSIHEKVTTLYRCDKCPFTSIRLTHLRRHEMSHSQTTYKCVQCTYKTDDNKLLTRHVKLKHERAEVEKGHSCPTEDFQCPECPYKTPKQSRFQRHLRVHDSTGRGIVRIYQCDQCIYKTNRKEHYIRHVNNVHINKRPFLCDFCGKAFKRPDALKQHRVTHTNNMDTRESTFRCNVCQKGCRSQAHLNEHQAVHSNVRSFLCEMCGASFKTRSVQRKHMLTIHKNPRSFVCDQCSKRFNTNYALRRHHRLHKSGASMTDDPDDCLAQEGDTVLTVAVSSDVPHQHSEVLEHAVKDEQNHHNAILKRVLSTASGIPITIHQITQMNAAPSATAVQLHENDNILTGSGSQESATTTLIPLQEALEQVVVDVSRQVPQPFVTSEATTALLYLTTNFTM